MLQLTHWLFTCIYGRFLLYWRSPYDQYDLGWHVCAWVPRLQVLPCLLEELPGHPPCPGPLGGAEAKGIESDALSICGRHGSVPLLRALRGLQARAAQAVPVASLGYAGAATPGRLFGGCAALDAA